MAYYSKKDVEKYINENNEAIEAKGHKPLAPVEHSIMQLENQEDIVGFFWVDIDEESGGGAKVGMKGKAFVRIDLNLYTDDRFALDLYQSQAESITVSQVINNRIIDQERAKKSVEPNKEDLENGFSEKLAPKK